MLVITATDLHEYKPTLEEYSGYERDNTVYDNQILSTTNNIKRFMKMENIDVDDILVEEDINFKYLLLSDVVYEYYSSNSYNVDEDNKYIRKLKEEKEENYRIFLKYFRYADDSIYSDITVNYSG